MSDTKDPRVHMARALSALTTVKHPETGFTLAQIFAIDTDVLRALTEVSDSVSTPKSVENPLNPYGTTSTNPRG